jgi:hypothetical protein
MKRGVIISVVVIVGVLGVATVYLLGISARTPPQEAKFVQLFNSHRSEFDKLREMLQQDTNLVSVADWGSRMRNPMNSLPPERYNEYMQLLKQVGGRAANREEGEHADPSVLLWGWGFAGHTKHLGICWLDEKPPNQVATLDGYHGRGSYGNRVITYRNIDTNWYLWTDL